MKKIVFFDIDGTLFDPDSFIESFKKTLSQKFGLNDQDFDEINRIHRDVKAEFDYFVPNVYLERISESFSISFSELKTAFWGSVSQFLFEDAKVIDEVSEIATVAFFSKGDEVFQKEKIKSLAEKFDEAHVFIYPEKIEKFEDAFGRFKDFEKYLVDDSLSVLTAAREFDSAIKTILIDRKGQEVQNENVDFIIKNLSDIMPILINE